MRLPTFYEQNLIPNWGRMLLMASRVSGLTRRLSTDTIGDSLDCWKLPFVLYVYSYSIG